MKAMKKALALLLAAVMVAGVGVPNVAKAADPVNLFDCTHADNIDNRLTYNGGYKDSTTNYVNMFTSHKMPVQYGDIVYWGGVGAEDYVACLYDASGTFIQQIRNNSDASIGTAGLAYVETGNTVVGYASRERKEVNFAIEITNTAAAYIIVIGNISTKSDLKVYKNLEDTTGWPTIERTVQPTNLFDKDSTDNALYTLRYKGTGASDVWQERYNATGYAYLFSTHYMPVNNGDIVYWGDSGQETYIMCIYDSNKSFLQQVLASEVEKITTSGTTQGYNGATRSLQRYAYEINVEGAAYVTIFANIDQMDTFAVYTNLHDTTGWPTIEKLAAGENLFDATSTDNIQNMLRHNGNETTDATKYANMFSSHLIPAQRGDVFYWGGVGKEQYVMTLHDANGNYLQQVKRDDADVAYATTGNKVVGYNGSSIDEVNFVYEVKNANTAYVSITGNISTINELVVYKNLTDTTGWPALPDKNLFNPTHADNIDNRLTYNGTYKDDTTNYANMFTSHKMPVNYGDIVYWGGVGAEDYVMCLYDSTGNFIEQIRNNADATLGTAGLAYEKTGRKVIGYGGVNERDEVNFAVEITNPDAASMIVIGNISTKDQLQVFVNLSNTTGWPTITPGGDVDVDTSVAATLKGKKILFAGDSITAATKDDAGLGGWAGRVGSWYGATATNAGISGYSVSTSKTTRIITELESNKGNTYDYVILHGGVNDAMTSAPLGTVSDSTAVADFDISTYAGALEELIYRAKEYFPTAKIGFIVNYATPNSTWGGYTKDMAAYFHTAKQVCEKWEVPYIDLFFGSVDVDGKMLSYSYDILDVDTATNFYGQDSTEVHIGGSGYDLITPYIAEFIASIGVETDGNLFDASSSSNLANTLRYNGNEKTDTTAYANMFTSHLIPAERGDVFYWGGVGKDQYIMAIYDKDGNYIQQVKRDDADVVYATTGNKVAGYNSTQIDEVKFVYEIKNSNAAYVTVTGNISTQASLVVYKNLEDTTGWPTAKDTNLFDRDSKDNQLATLLYNANSKTDYAKYSNMFTTHKMPVKDGDVVYWGGVGCEDYVLRLYDASGNYIQQIRNNTVANGGTESLVYTKTGLKTTGYNYSSKDLVNFAYEIDNENVAYMTVTGNITELDNLQVFVNLSNITGWPTLVPGVDDSNPLKGKKALFVGDSITYGGGDGGWVSRIAAENSLVVTNAGVSGSAVSVTSRVTSGERTRILTQLENNKSNSYNYVIMHGGMNDAWDSATVGTMSSSFDVADFDNTTYAGGLEELFYYAKQYFGYAQLGFIVNYNTPASTSGGNTANTGEYFRMAKQICEKWDIPYIDLYEGTVEVDGVELSYSDDILKVSEATYFRTAGDVHISATGYDVISPYIGAWMRTLGNGLNGCSLTLSGEIEVNFYMELSDAIASNKDAYMHFVLPNGYTTKVSVADATSTSNGYVFACGVSAKDMTGDIEAQLFSGDFAISDTYIYSVKQYADAIIADEATYGANAVALVKAMLNYGGYAQTYHGWKTDNLANVDLTATEKDLSSVTASSIADHMRGEQANDAIGSIAGSNLSLKSATTLMLYFQLADGVDVSALTFQVNGATVEAVKAGSYYLVSIENIAAHDLDTVYTITVSDGTNTLEATYSAMTYVYNILSRDRAQELKDVVAALRLYNLAANTYKEGV